MACETCRDNFISKATSNEISWQGNAVPELDVCIGDSLTRVENIVLAKIKDLLKGRGIVLDDLVISDCEIIQDYLGIQEKNLLNVLDAYKEAICELKSSVDLNATTIADFATIANYTLGCLGPLDPCGDPLTFKGLIQAIITKLCALNTQLDGMADSLLAIVEEGAGNFIGGGAITSCGGNGYTVSGVGDATVVTFEALVPPNCPIIYTGSTSMPNFDPSGVGQDGTPYCGWFLCNGSNGTPNANTLPQNGGGTIKYIIRFD